MNPTEQIVELEVAQAQQSMAEMRSVEAAVTQQSIDAGVQIAAIEADANVAIAQAQATQHDNEIALQLQLLRDEINSRIAAIEARVDMIAITTNPIVEIPSEPQITEPPIEEIIPTEPTEPPNEEPPNEEPPTDEKPKKKSGLHFGRK
jgi:hypothetical protein